MLPFLCRMKVKLLTNVPVYYWLNMMFCRKFFSDLTVSLWVAGIGPQVLINMWNELLGEFRCTLKTSLTLAREL